MPSKMIAALGWNGFDSVDETEDAKEFPKISPILANFFHLNFTHCPQESPPEPGPGRTRTRLENERMIARLGDAHELSPVLLFLSP